jgi:Prion-inhibition and propagation
MVSIVDATQASSAESPREIKPKNTLFSRRHRPSSSASSLVGRSASTSTAEVSPSSATSHSSIGSLNDPRVLKAIHDDSLQAKSLQSSSSILGRLKWASEDRNRFKSAVEELSKANDLLETLLKIKPPQDQTFLPSGGRLNHTTAQFISSTKAALESLHGDLLSINPQSGRDVEFSLKLVLDEADKETYANYVDTSFDADSSVFSLQAHSKSAHGKNQKSFYLLAETPTSEDIAIPVISNLVSTLQQTDPDAEPSFHCLGPVIAQSQKQKLRIYQDKTSEWCRTRTLADALQDQIFQDISFQRHYSQLGLFMAFSYAALPFAYRGQPQFPQPSNYSYYDQISVEDSKPASNNSRERSRENTVAETPTITVEGDDQSHVSRADPEVAFQELQSPYISFNFGSRRSMSTKTLGKRPGFTAVADNPVVALGLLLYQIGSWQYMPLGDIVQMRRDALERSHDLIRLSGVEFADITRACLNWKEAGLNGKRFDSEEMLVKVYARLDEYNKSLQALM